MRKGNKNIRKRVKKAILAYPKHINKARVNEEPNKEYK